MLRNSLGDLARTRTGAGLLKAIGPLLGIGFVSLNIIRSAMPFAALTMRSLTNERGDYLLTTFPVADANRAAPSPVVFPQIADGGGCVPQSILLSAGGASSEKLNFYGEIEAPLAVGKRWNPIAAESSGETLVVGLTTDY